MYILILFLYFSAEWSLSLPFSLMSSLLDEVSLYNVTCYCSFLWCGLLARVLGDYCESFRLPFSAKGILLLVNLTGKNSHILLWITHSFFFWSELSLCQWSLFRLQSSSTQLRLSILGVSLPLRGPSKSSPQRPPQNQASFRSSSPLCHSTRSWECHSLGHPVDIHSMTVSIPWK